MEELSGRGYTFNNSQRKSRRGENSVGRGQGMSKEEEVRNRIVCEAEEARP